MYVSNVFVPFFEYLEKNNNSHFGVHKLSIYLTDGYAGEPKIKPRCKVFWVITPNGTVGSHLKFGRVLQMQN